MKDKWVKIEARDTNCGERKMEDFRIERDSHQVVGTEKDLTVFLN